MLCEYPLVKGQYLDSKQVNWVNDTTCEVFDQNKLKHYTTHTVNTAVKHELLVSDSKDSRVGPAVASKISDKGLISKALGVPLDKVKGAPCVSFNLEINKSSMKNKHQIRVEDTFEYPFKTVSLNSENQYSLLSEEFKMICNDPKTDVKKFISRVGEFFAVQFTLGGIFSSTFQKVMRKEESVDDFKASIEVKTKKCSPKFGSSRLEKDSKDSEDIEVSVKAMGGDVTLFGEDTEDPERLQQLRKEWQQTCEDNPSGYDFKLKPIWILVNEVNPALAKDIEVHLTSLWNEEHDKANNLKFADKIVKMNNHSKHDDVKTRLSAATAELSKLSAAQVEERKAKKSQDYLNLVNVSNFDSGIAHCKTSTRKVEELLKLNDAPTDETDQESKLYDQWKFNHEQWKAGSGGDKEAQVNQTMAYMLADLQQILAWEEDAHQTHPQKNQI